MKRISYDTPSNYDIKCRSGSFAPNKCRFQMSFAYKIIMYRCLQKVNPFLRAMFLNLTGDLAPIGLHYSQKNNTNPKKKKQRKRKDIF